MTSQVKVLGFAGSLRQASYNRAALRAAVALAPEEVSIEVFDLSPLPLYNADLQAAGFPAAVENFKARIAQADALLVVTPEYNYSVPGVLKNAIDWASRPVDATPLARKPVAIMGASNGQWGTVRAQLHLRQILTAMNMPVLAKPEVMIAKAGEKFDEHGNLTDEATDKRIRQLVAALGDWTRRLRGH